MPSVGAEPQRPLSCSDGQVFSPLEGGAEGDAPDNEQGVRNGMRYVLSVIVIVVCVIYWVNEQAPIDRELVIRRWAKDAPSDEKVYLLQRETTWMNRKPVLGAGQRYKEITEEELRLADSLLVGFLRKEGLADDDNGKKNILEQYYRQYLCYVEKGKTYVLINLYAYTVDRHPSRYIDQIIAPCPSTIVIDPLKGNNKDFMRFLLDMDKRALRFY